MHMALAIPAATNLDRIIWSSWSFSPLHGCKKLY